MNKIFKQIWTSRRKMTEFEMLAGILGQRLLVFMEFTAALSTSAHLWYLCYVDWRSDIYIALWFAKGGEKKAYISN